MWETNGFRESVFLRDTQMYSCMLGKPLVSKVLWEFLTLGFLPNMAMSQNVGDRPPHQSTNRNDKPLLQEIHEILSLGVLFLKMRHSYVGVVLQILVKSKNKTPNSNRCEGYQSVSCVASMHHGLFGKNCNLCTTYFLGSG